MLWDIFKRAAVAAIFSLALAPLPTFAQTSVADYSFAQLQQASKAGDVEAMTYLADAYYDGDIVPQNYALSAEWYRRAADQGSAYGQTNLALFYELGRGPARGAQALYRGGERWLCY